MNHEWETELFLEILAVVEDVELDGVEVLDGLIKMVGAKVVH